MNKKLRPSHTLVLVITVYYLVTCIAAAVLGGLQSATHIPEVVLQITQFAPTLGVLAILAIFRGGNRPTLATGLKIKPFVIARVIAAALIAVLIFFAAVLCYHMFGKTVSVMSLSSLSQPFWLIFVAQFIGAAGEEFGWRCFLQPFLQTRLSVINSSVIVGVLWGTWHIGIFTEGPAFALLFMIAAVALSVIIGELLRDARNNYLYIATAFHAVINLGLLLLFTDNAGNVLDGTFAIATWAGVSVVVAVAAVLVNKVRNRSFSSTSTAASS